MRKPISMNFTLPIVSSFILALPAAAQFTAADKDGRIEIRDQGKLVFGYQHKPLKDPKGGEIFAASAFLHPLTTPSGFVLTDIQPSDHLHHYGVWWPWKLTQVGGKKYVTWEMQKKQGRHDAVEAKVMNVAPDQVLMSGVNQTKILPEEGEYKAVIKEDLAMRFGRLGADGYMLDIELVQQPEIQEPVTIAKYRYSGFSWRGSASWTAETSTMLTSGGHHRDNANHQPATWCMVHGKTPAGKATMLILSKASVDAGQHELMRVWGSKQHHGMPFVNFNPVVKESLELKAANKAVSHRSYRLIMVDRELDAEDANQYWEDWTGEKIKRE